MTDLIYRSFKNGKMLDEQGSLCFNISKGGSNMPDKIDSILKQFLVDTKYLRGIIYIFYPAPGLFICINNLCSFNFTL